MHLKQISLNNKLEVEIRGRISNLQNQYSKS